MAGTAAEFVAQLRLLGIRVAVDRTTLRARAVLIVSVLYLPLIYGLMLIDRPGL